MSKNQYHEHLLAVPLLSGLEHHELDAITQISTEMKIPAGRVLIREGSSAQEMVIVVDGTLEVTRNGEHVADIGPGGFAGELAVLRHSTRTATVTAKTEAVILHIDGAAFSVMLRSVPTIAVKMLPIVAERVASDDH